jgi:hypothetical protein
MKEIVADRSLVAFCGLYCGACGRYLKERCPGCRQNEKATWCKVRACCREAQYSSCAECTDYSDPKDCKKFNNFISKAVGFVFHSDRRACIMQIRMKGLETHAEDMASRKRHSIKPA